MDKIGASMERCLAMMSERFQTPPLPIQLPVVEGTWDLKVIDLLSMKVLEWEDSWGNQLLHVPC